MDEVFDSGGEVDWFGHPIRPDGGRPNEPVPCPLCGERFTSSAELDAHVRQLHGVVDRSRRPSRLPTVPVAAWLRSLKHLPLWFVLPLNLGLTALLWVVWGQDIELFSTDGDQSGVVKAWLIRLSILPAVLVLTWRVVDRKV